jgi:hypothetical protein
MMYRAIADVLLNAAQKGVASRRGFADDISTF